MFRAPLETHRNLQLHAFLMVKMANGIARRWKGSLIAILLSHFLCFYVKTGYGTWFTFLTQRRICSFNGFVLQRTTNKCSKNYQALAQPLFCSLNLWLSDFPVPLAFVAFLFLFTQYGGHNLTNRTYGLGSQCASLISDILLTMKICQGKVSVDQYHLTKLQDQV